MVQGPPRMGRAVMLPKFADGPGLPAPPRFGAWLGRADSLGKMLPNVGGHGRPGAVEVQAAGQFVGQQSKVQRLAVRQELSQEVVGGWGPGVFVGAPGATGMKRCAISEPLVAQLIEPGGTDHEPLSGGQGIQTTVVEGGQDFLNVERRKAMSPLLFFMVANLTHWGRCPKTPEGFRFGTRVERVAQPSGI